MVNGGQYRIKKSPVDPPTPILFWKARRCPNSSITSALKNSNKAHGEICRPIAPVPDLRSNSRMRRRTVDWLIPAALAIILTVKLQSVSSGVDVRILQRAWRILASDFFTRISALVINIIIQDRAYDCYTEKTRSRGSFLSPENPRLGRGF